MPLPDLLRHAPAALLGATGGSDGGDGGGTLFLGEDFFPWMILAFGAAMVVGNVLALARPPKDRPGGPPPVGRALAMAGVGVVGVVWALASLLS